MKREFADIVTDVPLSKADFAVLGVPVSINPKLRSGAEHGPRAIRKSSTWISRVSTKYGDAVKDKIKVVDVGDASVRHLKVQTILDNITSAVKLILEAKTVPIILGGDHSLTYPAVRAYQKKFDVFYFDAHPDSMNVAHGTNYGYASGVRRIAELDNCNKIYIIGVRAPEPEEVVFMKENKKIEVLWAEDHKKLHGFVKSRMRRSKNYYVSIDLDVLDPAFTPGVETPVPGGYQTREFLEVIRILANKKLIGMDVVECAPTYDESGITQRVAAKIILEVFRKFSESKR